MKATAFMALGSPQERMEDAVREARAGRLHEAERLLEGLLSEDAENLRALDLFGFVRFFQGRYAEAEAFCRRALELEPGRAYALKGLGLCLARQGHLEEGIQKLEEAIEAKPHWFDPYWDLAVVLSEHGRLEDALRVASRGEQAVPARSAELVELRGRLRLTAPDGPSTPRRRGTSPEGSG